MVPLVQRRSAAETGGPAKTRFTTCGCRTTCQCCKYECHVRSAHTTINTTTINYHHQPLCPPTTQTETVIAFETNCLHHHLPSIPSLSLSVIFYFSVSVAFRVNFAPTPSTNRNQQTSPHHPPQTNNRKSPIKQNTKNQHKNNQSRAGGRRRVKGETWMAKQTICLTM